MSDNWRPTASLQTLRARAQIISKIRSFFETRGVLEVETPLLSQATVTSPHLHSFSTQYLGDRLEPIKMLYLQTSPEYAMKRLLAAGSGPIFQLCKAFRNGGESGRLHNPEFTMLEWYQPGFDHHALMAEVDALLSNLLGTTTALRYSYAEIFQHYLAINPHECSPQALAEVAAHQNIKITVTADNLNKDDWLNLLMTHVIEPRIGTNVPAFIYDFPASQAALARIRADDPPVAERFEVYYKGIELANGFHELTDTQEQRARFNNELKEREQLTYPQLPLDENLLAALAHGISACAGVAVGIDRLILLALEKKNIAEIVSFTTDHA